MPEFCWHDHSRFREIIFYLINNYVWAYDYDYDYGYTDENLYAQGEDVTYGQDEYTEQTNNY